MKLTWVVAGCMGLLVGAPALAHELECEKTVNGETLLSVDSYPVTLDYSLTVRNIHPTSPSDVLGADDPLLDLLGFQGFDVPFTLALGAEQTKTFDVTLNNQADCERISAMDGTEDENIDNTFTVTWDNGSDSCSARVECAEAPPPPPEDGGVTPPEDGGVEIANHRMTGGGSVFGTGRNRVTHGFEIHCDPNDPRQNLEVNWQGNRFHLTDMTSASCFEDPSFSEGQPPAGFNTYVGEGTGLYNGVPGATISFTFTDKGEPGKNDTAQMTITDANGNVVLDVSGTLQYGNHQAHP